MKDYDATTRDAIWQESVKSQKKDTIKKSQSYSRTNVESELIKEKQYGRRDEQRVSSYKVVRVNVPSK